MTHQFLTKPKDADKLPPEIGQLSSAIELVIVVFVADKPAESAFLSPKADQQMR